MRPPAEQLIRDYLNRLSVAARTRLQSDDRRAFLARTREHIEQQSGGRDTADPAVVLRILNDLGEPEAAVEREHARLATLHSERAAAAARAGLWKSRARTSGTGRDDGSGTGQGSENGAEPPEPGKAPRTAPSQPKIDGRPLTGEITVSSRPISARWKPGAPLTERQSRPQRVPRPRRGGSQQPPASGPVKPGTEGGPSAATGPPSAPAAPRGTAPAGTAGPGGPAPSEPPAGSAGVRPAATGRAGAGPGTTGPRGTASAGAAPAGPRDAASTGAAANGQRGGAGASGAAATGQRGGAAPAGPAAAGPAAAGPGAQGSGGSERGAGPSRPRGAAAGQAPSGGAATEAAPSASGQQRAAVPATARLTTARQRRLQLIQPTDVTKGFAEAVADAWRQHRLEVIAVALLAIAGLIFPYPIWVIGFLLWLIGSSVVLSSKLWSRVDKWLTVPGLLALVIVGTAIAESLGGKRPDAAAYGDEARGAAATIFKIAMLLAAVYLAWRTQRGPRDRAMPSWARHHHR
jgi:hypothetical protein